MDPTIKALFYVAACICFGIGAFRPVDRNIKFCAVHMVAIGWLLLVIPLTYETLQDGF